MPDDELARQGRRLCLGCVQTFGCQPALFQPPVELMRQRHDVGGDHKALGLADFLPYGAGDFLGKERRPQALDR